MDKIPKDVTDTKNIDCAAFISIQYILHFFCSEMAFKYCRSCCIVFDRTVHNRADPRPPGP